jgi:hypothetical protein
VLEESAQDGDVFHERLDDWAGFTESLHLQGYYGLATLVRELNAWAIHRDVLAFGLRTPGNFGHHPQPVMADLCKGSAGIFLSEGGKVASETRQTDFS